MSEMAMESRREGYGNKCRSVTVIFCVERR